jgi:putative nucleotidyltransferase with HDIG domain
VSRSKVNGVLEVFHRSLLERDPDWLDFLKTLASQAAIAIDHATLFIDLQRSNIELNQAYNSTLEGWSRALDLRDRETEGHSQRVTELALQLARAMSVDEPELVHIRRGALLHDIGKLGIPDNILLKPGLLSDEEMDIMRKHPSIAYELLAPITYLSSALDIPYYHHEKWDGSGYPEGLKGEDIPISARIFAVVDVWDALISDRPYRKSWSEDKALTYLQEQSGQHFDPRIVDTFLSMLNEDRKATRYPETK